MAEGYTTEDGKRLITLIRGDGIGREVTDAACQVLTAAGANIAWEEVEAGAKVFKSGNATGITAETIASIQKTKVVLKGPLETPIGYGEKSANVTLRMLFETFANIRPVQTLPGIQTPFQDRCIDLVVVRENIEDLYAGIEHMQTPNVAQCLKLMSHRGCEKVVRLAFELARAEGRELVHCATKANIMKLTEGMLKRVFESVAKEYPDIRAEHIIIDNCAHQLVVRPEQFDVIVTSNMNGDILSDLTSGLVGGLGLAPAANLGSEVSIFEAVHGSAPTIAGKNIANPTALILSAALMLRHIGEFSTAEKIQNAVLVTLAEGKVQTADLTQENPATTEAVTQEIISNLGRAPEQVPCREYRPLAIAPTTKAPTTTVEVKERRYVGVDIFIESTLDANALGENLKQLSAQSELQLKLIANRGTRVYPPLGTKTDVVDHWRCRFVLREPQAAMTDATLLPLLEKIGATHRWMHVEKLPEFAGRPAYSKAQGED